ncbi:GntR family transcriptional regulator [Desertimonas flava]|uniref:GntR family transcriptional regulator n=1 Tax=Desertimonas flava TaxID=2064846 RepID=UPI000E352818|nr:GntR family transcriptional regulator [Desertimonas flava]
MAAVSDALRNDILNGEFPPGERLIELQLAERYRVGRAAIRSAIVELSAEGLVAHETNRGATVRRISLAEAIEIAEARGALESLLARRAAERATDAEREELAGIVTEMRAAVAGNRQTAYSELNRVLHRRIREISRHETAAELVGILRNRGAHHQFRLATMPGRASDSLPQHAAIVDAIIRGDGDAAAEAMHGHLLSVQDVLRSWAEHH